MTPQVQAGTLSPGLARLLATKSEDDIVRVLVVLPEQLDVPALDQSLRTAKATSAVRHEVVVRGLQDLASNSQADLIAHLEFNKSSQGLQGFTPHWLVNAIVVTGSVSAIRTLAQRADVGQIEPDLVPQLIAPVATWQPSKTVAGFGTANGVVAIGARRVWHELGFDGTGTLVGILDTGVDASHPALSSRWQGNFSPLAQTWFDAAQFGVGDFPQDNNGHGTHVLSIVTGAAEGDTVGVAPGAHWIAANGIAAPSYLFDNAILASLEFMTDPDGDPATNDDVPDVLQNSWGVNEGFGPYLNCDSRWWDMIDNCEAAGVVLIWAAGNEGPVGGTLRSPADRASNPYNCFAVGSTSNHTPFTISAYSSRGPSGCGGVYAIKPEITAPGDTVLGAAVGGGYFFSNGTSMAAPHVAGVVALMRQANPDVDVVTIKDILLQTAVDLGSAGEDNVYGHGFLDAYAAVLAVMDGVGTVSGAVTDAVTTEPVVGALVKRSDGDNQDITDELGNYSFTMYSGDTDFTASAFGYFDSEFQVVIPDGGSILADLTLQPEPTAVVMGQISGPLGAPVPGATIIAEGTPLSTVVADSGGNYQIVVPIGQNQSYSLRASAPGLGALAQSVVITNDLTLDFSLPALSREDFESAGFLAYPWTFAGDSGWQISTVNPYEGVYSARSGPIANDQTSVLNLDYFVETIGELSFWYLVSTEDTYDFLDFSLDGVLLGSWSGELGWSLFSVEVPRGPHSFQWKYRKDDIAAAGADAVFLDMITLPTPGVQQYPALAVSPISVFKTMAPDQQLFCNFMITNVGGEDLHFTVTGQSINNAAFKAKPRSISVSEITRRTLGKGEKDRTPFEVVTPDPSEVKSQHTYTYRDSDDPQGPSFFWQDISTVGTEITAGDDLTLGPFDLEFPMTFYGAIWNSVYISTNGFISFSFTASPYVNPILPDFVAPNNLVAPFWDDLDSSAGGAVYYWADPNSDRFIVQYEAVRRYGGQATETFQVILKSDGSLTCQYLEVSETGYCTVGIENVDGDLGLTVLHNSAGYLHNNFAVRFEPPGFLPWLSFSPLAGTIVPGAETALNLVLDTGGLSAGIYVATLNLLSDDPNNPNQILVVSLIVSEASSVGGSPLSAKVVLVGAAPNPFNPRTDIRFRLPRSGHVSLRIYDVKGRLVRTLFAETKSAGDHAVAWDGTDDQGRALASGTYYSRLVSGDETRVKAMALVR